MLHFPLSPVRSDIKIQGKLEVYITREHSGKSTAFSHIKIIPFLKVLVKNVFNTI